MTVGLVGDQGRSRVAGTRAVAVVMEGSMDWDVF